MRVVAVGRAADHRDAAGVHAWLGDHGVDVRAVALDDPASSGTSARRCLQQVRPDAVLVDAAPGSWSVVRWVLAARGARVPVAVAAGGEPGDDGRLARAWRSLGLRAAARAYVRTPAAAPWARRAGARGPIHLVPPVVPPGTVTPTTSGPTLTVGYVGPLRAADGILDLLGAIDRLPSLTRLLVAGEGPLRATVAGHRKVHLWPEASPALYEALDVLVDPTRDRDATPSAHPALLHAMAHGRPVIAATTGRIPWELCEANGGMTVPAGDVQALAGLLLDVRNDRHRWASLGEQGRRDVIDRFPPEATGAALLALLRDLGATPSGQ